MKKIFTVTVGIPAYNEEANIGYLLESVLKQERKTYVLEKIIVISDGSSDHTEDIVANLAKENSSITLVVDKKRIGKAKRLMQLYTLNTSDYVVQIDADTDLRTNTVMDNLIKKFVNQKVAVVSGNVQPVSPKTYIEYLFYVWFKLWDDIKKNVKDQNVMDNAHSQIIVLRREFAKKIKLVPQVPSSGQFIFCFAKQQKLLFRYADDAVVYFRLPTNIHDYLLQLNRTTDEKKQLAKLFGNWVYDVFKIPQSVKLKVLLKHLLVEPLDTFLAASLIFILRFAPQTNAQKIQDGKWKTVGSTKKLQY